MNIENFYELCLAASEELGLANTSALGFGMDVLLDDVLIEAMFSDGATSMLLLADLGAIADADKAGVCETLLAMQLAACDDRRVRFGFHPMRGALVLCIPVALGHDADATHLALVLRAAAQQVRQWRASLLSGRATARREGDEYLTSGLGGDSSAGHSQADEAQRNGI
ncbi:MAG: hypothetical protein H7238_12430 [Polaromonas sp.]|nr:hypothetical protein [Polaromonas sp.]